MSIQPFDELAEEYEGRKRPYYRVSLISKVLGIAVSTLNDEMRAGRLKYFRPVGCRKGTYLRGEWVDQWIKEGTHV